MPGSEKYPPQPQEQPGREHKMKPVPEIEDESYTGCGKLRGKVALITGGDSGIGSATAILYAKEGARIAIAYLEEHEDARNTRNRIEELGGECLLIDGDVGDESFCKRAVSETVERFGGLDILVNNAAEQHYRKDFDELTYEALDRTFRTNIYSMFFLVAAAFPHLKEGAVIINTTSVTAYRGNPMLLDYSATKGAIVALTRSLASRLAEKKIRVNAVAPGPIWTPLIPSTFPPEYVESFGKGPAMGRAGEPREVAPCFLFLASSDSSYMTGQVLHPNGGEIING